MRDKNRNKRGKSNRGGRSYSTKYDYLKRSKMTTLLYFAILLAAVYIVASFYTSYTGNFGRRISGALLSWSGGASVVPLLFAVYVCIAKLLNKPIPNIVRQLIGTLLVFLLGALLLGINAITHSGGAIARGLLPGSLGIVTAKTALSSFGVLGTLLAGLIAIYAALLLYNIHLFARFKKFDIPSPDFSAFFNRFKKEKAEDEEMPEAKTDSAEEGYGEKDAPNIAEYDGNDYFGSTRAPYDEITSVRAASKGETTTLGTGETESHEGENTPLQDPSFNFEESGDTGIKAGVFPPPIEIFGHEESREGEFDEAKARPLGEKIIETLDEFGIEARLAEVLVGPTVIQFRIQLAPGIKVNKIASLTNDIALAMAVPSLRVEAPIPGKPYVGIEIPNPKRRGIPIRTIIESESYQNTKATLPLPLGIAVNGESSVTGLEDLPHLLVAGTTGSGKSVFINSCIVGLCSARTPEELRMVLVDPKRVEMAIYDKLPHLLTPPVTDPKKAVHVLAWAIREMEERYSSFASVRVRNLEGYNKKVLPKDRLYNIVIVIDELADLMMTAAKEAEEYICRIAQMARATGIHLLIATQRPSVDVVTGLIKANIPARAAFTLPTNSDSRTILDCAGAEKLLGKGDMLFLSTRNPKPVRIQSPWVAEDILVDWLDYLENTFGAPEFIDIENQVATVSGLDESAFDDELLEDAIETVMSTGIASASGLQRRLRVGFARASRLIDMMEQLGIVGPADGSKPRDILTDDEGAEEILDKLRGI